VADLGEVGGALGQSQPKRHGYGGMGGKRRTIRASFQKSHAVENAV
jgi:hypothetical protein